MGSQYDAIFARFFSGGAEVELGAGVDCSGGVTAVTEHTTQRREIGLDAHAIISSGYSSQGDVTAVDLGEGFVPLYLDEDADWIPLADLVGRGEAREIRFDIWLADDDLETLYRDYVHVYVYHELASGEVHVGDVRSTAQDVSSTTATITVTGINSTIDYTCEASVAGGVVLEAEEDVVDRVARVDVYLGIPQAIGA